MLKGPVQGQFDAAYALDVLEHIQPATKIGLLRNDSLADANGHRDFWNAVSEIPNPRVTAKQGRSRQLQIRRRIQANARAILPFGICIFDE